MKRKLKDFIIDPKGQWNHPGKKTYIPNANGSITMKNVPYPVLGIDDEGNQQMMYPNREYQFPGNSVYEIPMVQFGGTFDPETDEFIGFSDELPKAQDGLEKKGFDSLSESQKALLQKGNNLDKVKGWYEKYPDEMQNYKAFIDQHNADDYLKLYDTEKEKFDESVKNNAEWHKNWLAKRAQLPQFKDVATQRLNNYTDEDLQSASLIDPVNFAFSRWKNQQEGMMGRIKKNSETGKYELLPIDTDAPPSRFEFPTDKLFGEYEPNSKQVLVNSKLVNQGYYDVNGKLHNQTLDHEYDHKQGDDFPQEGTTGHISEKSWKNYETDLLNSSKTPNAPYNVLYKEPTVEDPLQRVISYTDIQRDPRTWIKGDSRKSDVYQYEPTEVRARLDIWRQYNNIDALKDYSEDEIREIMQKNDKDPNLPRNIKELFQTIQETPSKLKYINESYVSNDQQSPLDRFLPQGDIPKAQVGKQVKRNWDLPEGFGGYQKMEPSSTRVAPVVNHVKEAQYRAQAAKDVANPKITDDDFRDKHGYNKHVYQMNNDPQYKAEVEANSKELVKRNGSIDLPSTYMDSKSFTGNPNLNYMIPNGLTGEARKAYEESQMNVVGAALPIPGLQQVGRLPSIGTGLQNLVRAVGPESGLLSKFVRPAESLANPVVNAVDPRFVFNEEAFSRAVREGTGRGRITPTNPDAWMPQSVEFANQFPREAHAHNVFLNSAEVLDGYVPEASKVIPEKPSWILNEPQTNSLQIRSTQIGSPLEKQLSKTGEININSLRAHIGKSEVGKQDKFIIDKVLNEKFPDKTKIDYNDFKKAVSDELVDFERSVFIDKNTNHGVGQLGFTGPSRKSVESSIKSNKNEIEKLENLLKNPDEIQPTSWRTKEQLIEDYKVNLAESKISYKQNLEFLDNLPLDNKTIAYGNTSKFGRGKTHMFGEHPENTLGHARTLVTPQEPDIMHILESQSDYWQKLGKIDPNDIENFKSILAEKELEYANDVENLKSAMETRKNASGESMSDAQITKYIEDVKQKKIDLDLAKGEFANPQQKQFLGQRHQERLFQENLMYAAQEGKSKMRYPTSETAAKIQKYNKIQLGPQTRDEILNNSFEDFIKIKEELSGTKLKQNEIDFSKKLYDDVKAKNGEGLFEFYEPSLQSILRKYDETPQMIKRTLGTEPKIVTDSKGHTWYEVDIPENYKNGKAEIIAFALGGTTLGTRKLQTKKTGGTFNPDTDEFIGYSNELENYQKAGEYKPIEGTNRKVTPEGIKYPKGTNGIAYNVDIAPGVEIVDNMPDNLKGYETMLPIGATEREGERTYDKFQDKYRYSKQNQSKRDTVIDLTNQKMAWFPFNTIPKDQYSTIIGNNYVEKAKDLTGFPSGNSEDYAKNWIQRMLDPEDTFRNKDYAEEAGSYYRSKDIPAFYGIENGKFKVGNPNEFSESTMIVPVRNGATPYAKIEKEDGIINNKTYTYDKSGNKIWNLNGKDKYIVYSPKTKKAIFRSQQESGSVAESKKILEDFAKQNPDAYIIPMDEGRFASYQTNSEGLSEDDFKNWNTKAGTVLLDYLTKTGNVPTKSPSGYGYGYNFGILKKEGGENLTTYQKGKQVMQPDALSVKQPTPRYQAEKYYKENPAIPKTAMTYNDNRSFYDSHAVIPGRYTENNPQYNDLVKRLVYEGKVAYDPTTGVMHRLKEKIDIPEGRAEMATEAYARKPIDERLRTNKAARKNLAMSQMIEMGNSPGFYAPGAIAGAALAGPAALAGLSTAMTAPFSVGATTIPWLTAGDVVGAGFALNGANKLGKDLNSGYYTSNAPTGDKIARGVETGLDLFSLPGAIPATVAGVKGLGQAGKYVANNTNVAQGLRNQVGSALLSRSLRGKLPVEAIPEIQRIDPIGRSSVNVENDFIRNMSADEYDDLVKAIYNQNTNAFDNPLVEFKSSRAATQRVANLKEYWARNAEGKVFKQKFCPPGSECAKSSNAVANKLYTDITGKEFDVTGNAHNAWHLEDQMTRNGALPIQNLGDLKVGDRLLMGNGVNQSTYVPGYTADKSIRHAGTYAGLMEHNNNYYQMLLESGANGPMVLNSIHSPFTGPNSLRKAFRPQQFVGDEFGEALVNKNLRYAFRNKPSVATYSSQNEKVQSILTEAEQHREQIKRMHDLTNDEFDEMLLSLVGVGAQETKLNTALPGSKLAKAKIKLQNILADTGLTKPIKETINAGKRIVNKATAKSSNLPEFPGAAAIEMQSATLAEEAGIPYSQALKTVKSKYQSPPKFRESTVEASKGMFRQKFRTEEAITSNLEDRIVMDEVGHGLSQMGENYKIMKKMYPEATPRQLIDLTTLMWNSPGKAKNRELVEFFIFGKNNPNPSKFNFDYVTKVKNQRNKLVDIQPRSVDDHMEYFRNGEYPEVQYKKGGIFDPNIDEFLGFVD